MEHLQPKISGSNYPFSDKLVSPQVQRSACDWSHSYVTTIPEAGALIPIFCEEVLAGSDYDINVEALIRVLPQVVPLYSIQRIYIDAFYVPYSSVWKNGLIYMSKGDTGNVNLTKPLLKPRLDWGNNDEGIYCSAQDSNYVVQPDDIFQFLGLPIGKKLSELGEINCLPVASYISIYRNYYMNRNVRLGDKDWFPDDPSDFRVNDEGTFISSITPTKYTCSVLVGFKGTESSSFPSNINVNKGYFYRDYADDYFTSALPFPQRGDAPRLNISTSVTVPGGNYPLKFRQEENSGSYIHGGLRVGFSNEDFSGVSTYMAGFGGDEASSSNSISLYDTNTLDRKGFIDFILRNPGEDTYSMTNANAGVTIPPSNISLSSLGFTLDEFRQLAIAQQELELMARTDGSSSQFYYTFFGVSPRRAVDYRPVYIGGTYKDLIFSEVVQQSASTEASPLGSYAGHGIASLSGNCGSVHTDENGYIMVIASIMPDMYYTQGLGKMWTRNTQDEEFLPGRDKMGLVPIYNRELYVSGNSNIDGDLFAYQDSYDEFRYKDNRISGKIADPNNNSFSPYTQARFFANSPKYSSDFMSSKNIRKDYLSAPVEDAYTGRFEFKIKAIQPITFKGNPAPVI